MIQQHIYRTRFIMLKRLKPQYIPLPVDPFLRKCKDPFVDIWLMMELLSGWQEEMQMDLTHVWFSSNHPGKA